MGAAIQFKGKAPVMEAYNSRGVVSFALCQGKAMIFKYQGDEESDSLENGAEYLDTCLEQLKDSAAIYTLKVFEDPGAKIRSNTPDDGSFNFRLNFADPEGGQSIRGYQGAGNTEILSELAAINKRLDQQEQEEEEEENEAAGNADLQAIKGTIAGILGNPAIMPVIASLATAWAQKLFPAGTPAPDPATMATLPALGYLAGVEDPALHNAIATLRAADPLLTAHLTKLAKIASEKPETYAMLITLLNRDL